MVCKLYAPTETFNLKDVGRSAVNLGTSAVNIAKGVAEKIPDVIPSADDFFQSTKNLIAGYPFEKVNLTFILQFQCKLNDYSR